MLADTNERPGVEEQYQTANNASNLRVEADRNGAADVLIAAGYSQSRLGMALLRLHSEWDKAAKPKKVSAFSLHVIEHEIQLEDERAKKSADREGGAYTRPAGTLAARASARAAGWYTNELRILATGLKSRPAVWGELAPWLALKGIDAEIGSAALMHWLDPVCPHCVKGLKKVPDQPALSAKQCNRCHGTGRRPAPKDSGRVLGHLDYCVGVARGSLKKRLRPR